MQRLYEETESEVTRNRIRAFMTRVPCQVCKGARLKPEILAVTIKDSSGRELNIHEFCEQTISSAAEYTAHLQLTPQQQEIAGEIIHEIASRLQFLVEVGLDYLTLNRESGTLSGGEAQRIRLATQIGSGLAGVLYVLDEPSIGLHQRDNAVPARDRAVANWSRKARSPSCCARRIPRPPIISPGGRGSTFRACALSRARASMAKGG
jgi:excinuclease ABC subunit A